MKRAGDQKTNACERKKASWKLLFLQKNVLVSFCGVFGLRQATPKCQLQSVHFKLKLELSGLSSVAPEVGKSMGWRVGRWNCEPNKQAGLCS